MFTKHSPLFPIQFISFITDFFADSKIIPIFAIGKQS